MRYRSWGVGVAGLVLAGGLAAGCNSDVKTDAANAPGTSRIVPAPSTETSDSHAGSGHSMHSPSMQRLHAATGTDFERGWLTAMIEHHQGAVDMSRMALKHLKRDEIRQAAQKTIRDQEKEIAQMRSWLQKWSGSASEPEMAQLAKSEMDGMMQAFERDCKSDCDRAFLTHMIPHHQGAIDMAPMAQQKATHPELKQFAGKIVQMQRQEIGQFQRWLADK